MVSSTLFASLAALSSLVAINGAIVQRDGTPGHTSPHQGAGNSTALPPSSQTTSTVTITSQPTTSSTGNVPPVTNSTSPSMTSASITQTTTPSPTPSVGTANCDGVQQWQSAFAYTAGDQAIYENALYQATQWTYNNAPTSHTDQWAAKGACAQPISNSANCGGVSAWQSNVPYTAGNEVTYNNHLYSAVQWTQSNAPGDNSGTWKDLGACA